MVKSPGVSMLMLQLETPDRLRAILPSRAPSFGVGMGLETLNDRVEIMLRLAITYGDASDRENNIRRDCVTTVTLGSSFNRRVMPNNAPFWVIRS